MKKLRIQPSFASLSEDELEQLACMIQRETFAIVLERARKPRSEGGFALTLRSESPLERLLDKKNKLDLINARLCAECSDHKKLTLAELNTFISMEKRAPDEVHEAIMSATYNLVTEHDNTPHQLLALQRLADFPARAEIREQTAAIRAARMQIARSKEQRAQEMHTHKIQLDLRKLDLKLHMAEFQKQITTARLALREKQHADRHSSPSPLRGVRGSSTSDEFEPTSDSNLDRSSSRRKDNSTRPKIRILVDEDGEPFTRFPTPNPLPDDVVIKNRAYTKKLLSGLIDPDTWEELDAPTPASLAFARGTNGVIQDEPSLCATPAPSSNGATNGTCPTSTSRDEINSNEGVSSIQPDESNESDRESDLTQNRWGEANRESDSAHIRTGVAEPTSISRDAITPANAAPADPNATEVHTSFPYADPKSEISNQKSEIGLTPAPETQNSEQQIQTSSSSVPSPSVLSVLLSPSELAAAVDRYTVNRAREHVAYEQKITAWPHAYSPPEYITQFRHCPCGHPSPCPVHESEEFGPFLERFWKVSPFNFLYRDSLRDRNLPYREPTEFSA